MFENQTPYWKLFSQLKDQRNVNEVLNSNLLVKLNNESIKL